MSVHFEKRWRCPSIRAESTFPDTRGRTARTEKSAELGSENQDLDHPLNRQSVPRNKFCSDDSPHRFPSSFCSHADVTPIYAIGDPERTVRVFAFRPLRPELCGRFEKRLTCGFIQGRI